MKAGILIVFGNIDFTADNSEATVNEIYASFVFSAEQDPAEKAEEFMEMFDYPSYIIPQYYTGKIIWKK